VISGGHESRETGVAEAYRQAGAHVLNTAEQGAIAATIDARGMRVEGFR
jgi:beta-lactamase superfamily II metal-dependent hydrolase